VFNLTLDLYTPIGVPASLGPRPAFIAIHSGGYGTNNERGFKPTYEMTAACKYFAARGYIALTMNYRVDNKQTGGGLAPKNWSGVPSPLGHGWPGGFNPDPQHIYAAIRDTKAAIRWLRGVSEAGSPVLQGSVLASEYVGAGGWSSGACTTVFLASQKEGDFKDEMDASTDPTFNTMVPYLNQSSAIKAGVVWAGNGAVTDTINNLSALDRFSTPSMPLAMYRGSKDTSMTPWAQQEVQGKFNASGSRCDLFAAPGVGHSSLFPTGNVTTKNGSPVAKPMLVLDHSYGWIGSAMGLAVV
jgi:dienelactone hydrolase